MIPFVFDKSDAAKIQGLKDHTEKARKAMLDASPAMRAASVFLDSWVQKNFKTEGGNVGGWEPFAHGGRLKPPASGEGRWTFDRTAKLLQDTGSLRASFVPFATKDNAGIGSNLSYADDHHKGQGVAERRLLPKKSEVRKPLRDILEAYVQHDVVAEISKTFGQVSKHSGALGNLAKLGAGPLDDIILGKALHEGGGGGEGGGS